MPIRSSEFFIFNNERSDKYGILNVNMSSGMQTEPFGSNRTILEQSIRGTSKRYFQEIQEEPLEFTVSFAFEYTFDDEKIQRVSEWLTSPTFYAPLQFSDNLDKIYYCLVIDTPEMIHNCLNQGYINLHFRCFDAYVYSPVRESILDLTSNPSGTNYAFTNLGSVDCYPLIDIYKVGNGDVSIFNHSNGNFEMTMKNLVDQELVTIDCENKDIVTNIPLTYRYDNLQGDFMYFVTGNNYLFIQGNCEIRLRYQFKWKQ